MRIHTACPLCACSRRGRCAETSTEQMLAPRRGRVRANVAPVPGPPPAVPIAIAILASDAFALFCCCLFYSAGKPFCRCRMNLSRHGHGHYTGCRGAQHQLSTNNAVVAHSLRRLRLVLRILLHCVSVFLNVQQSGTLTSRHRNRFLRAEVEASVLHHCGTCRWWMHSK